MTSEPRRSMVTGNASTPTTRAVSSGSEIGQIDQDLRLIRKPAPMPRNEPSRTKLEK